MSEMVRVIDVYCPTCGSDDNEVKWEGRWQKPPFLMPADVLRTRPLRCNRCNKRGGLVATESVENRMTEGAKA